MKKIILFLYLTLITLFSFGYTLVGCKANQEEQEEPELTQISVAGYFELTSPIRYSSTTAVTKWEFDFYDDGIVKQYLVGVNNGNIITQTLYGKYVCYEEIDGLFVLWEGGSYPDDVKAFKYDGLTINNGIATFKLCACNDRGEFSGKAVRVEYETEFGGEIVGESIQYLKKGDSCSSVTAKPNKRYEFSGWSDGVMSPTRQDTELTEDFSVCALFTPIPPVDYGDFTSFVYYYGQDILDNYTEYYGEYYTYTFRVYSGEEILAAFNQPECKWELGGITPYLQIETVKIISALVVESLPTKSNPDNTAYSSFFAFNIKTNDKYSYYQLDCHDNFGSLIESNTLSHYENSSIYYLKANS